MGGGASKAGLTVGYTAVTIEPSGCPKISSVTVAWVGERRRKGDLVKVKKERAKERCSYNLRCHYKGLRRSISTPVRKFIPDEVVEVLTTQIQNLSKSAVKLSDRVSRGCGESNGL